MIRCYALTCCLAVMLSGCGGSQASLGPSSAMPHVAALASHADLGPSWMLPEAGGEDLVYADASGKGAGTVYVFSYPKGKLVGAIAQPDAQYQQGLCSDAKGDVFVTTLANADNGGNIYEYAHGGTKPIRTLFEPGVWPWGCGVDPSTGNLAVASINLASLNSFVEVYQGAKGTPKLYSNNQIINYMFCGYDDKGNLFVDGSGSGPQVYFAELPRGGSALTNISLSKTIDWYGQVQWDGMHITLEDKPNSAIYRLKVSGSNATVIGTTLLERWTNAAPAQSWIENGSVLLPNGDKAMEIGIWNYPGGGNPTDLFTTSALFGVTVSSARPLRA